MVFTDMQLAMSDESVCRNCFYKDRIVPKFSCTHNTREKVYTQWNAVDGRHETTERSIRPFIPEIFQYVAMCDPYRGTCREDQCTFAHGRAEQKAWNSILRKRREHTGKNREMACLVLEIFLGVKKGGFEEIYIIVHVAIGRGGLEPIPRFFSLTALCSVLVS